MNSIEKYLRKNTKLSTILYFFSSLIYFIFFIYSDIYLIEPIIDIPEIIDSLMFLVFVYNLYSNNDSEGFKRQKDKFVI